MQTILTVDNSEYFRKALKVVLERKKFSVVEAPDGREAKKIFAAGKFDAIISGQQMPHCTGLELLEWVQETRKLPFILIPDHLDEKLTREALKKGAYAVIPKPFKDHEILNVLNSIFSKKAAEKPANTNLDDLYCRVSIDDFVVGKTMPFSVAIRLSASKYVKVAHKGEEIRIEQIKNYMTKGLKHLYVKKDEYAQVVGFNLFLAKKMKDTGNISEEKKRQFIKYTGEVVLEQAYVAGLDERSFRTAKEFVETSLGVVSEDDDALNMLMQLNSHSDYQYAHALGVSTISVMVAKAMKWDSLSNTFKIALAGMFHDIGQKEIPKDILEKPRHLVTAEERALIETHPMRGKNILEGLKSMPEDLVQVTFQHHEDCLAQGFPRRLKKSEIHPLAKLIYLVDVFLHYTLKSKDYEGMDAAKAITKIEMYHKDEVDADLLSALKFCLQKIA